MAKKGTPKWFLKGDEGKKMAESVDKQAQERRSRTGPMRFYLPYDTSARVTFLDDPVFFIWEHNIKLGQNFNNFFTCIGNFDTCPLCEDLGDNPAFGVVCTVINHRKYEDKKGNVHQHQKQLMVAKGKARQILLRQLDRHKTMKHIMYEAARGSTQTESNVGEDYERLGKVSVEKLKKLIPEGEDESWLKPFNYEEIFQPKPASELRKIIGSDDPAGAASNTGGEVDDILNEEPSSEVEAPFEVGDEDGGGDDDEGGEGAIDDLLK